MKRVSSFRIDRELFGGGRKVMCKMRKTLRSLWKKAVLVIRTTRSSRKDVIEWAVNGSQFGWYRGSKSFVPFRAKDFFYFLIYSRKLITN